MAWVVFAICYAVAAGSFYVLSVKTAEPHVELKVVDGQADTQSRAA
ncbi:MAG: hypothetical protein JNM28_06115 [Armatimonadetes bacterium]|nr:hypothetical protein [Armatimonadota bacterium]MBS1711578.1 hypothetical protein [Armatimonadota bacterium]MBX3109867.1 hypothetical protein [Fimbriimonadaceae bacterium]